MWCSEVNLNFEVWRFGFSLQLYICKSLKKFLIYKMVIMIASPQLSLIELLWSNADMHVRAIFKLSNAVQMLLFIWSLLPVWLQFSKLTLLTFPVFAPLKFNYLLKLKFYKAEIKKKKRRRNWRLFKQEKTQSSYNFFYIWNDACRFFSLFHE